MSAPSPSSAPPLSTHIHSDGPRRKLRKGTFSCWECKRRKIRCTFNPNTDSLTCNGCRRRGTQCVSQAFPEPQDIAPHGLLRDGCDNVVRDCPELPPGVTPASVSTEAAYAFAFDQTAESKLPARGKYERLSRFLYASLPSREETERICTTSRYPAFLTHDIMIMPYTSLEQNGFKRTASLLDIPEVNAHPVLIAKHMLLLASVLQLLHPEENREIKGLSESPRAIMERLVNLSVKLVTTNDELLGSLEGLECIMLESLYQANIGNLRRSWISCRRAMNIAQLMGLNRPGNQTQYKVLDRKTQYHTDHMWFRIVFVDRYLSLMLGASQGCLDRSMAADAILAEDTPMGCLERIHCVIASRILERNDSPPSYDDIALTRALDVELQKAAQILPNKWWLIPELEATSPESPTLFWSTRRMFVQVMHYNLLNQLHLPYMLCSSSLGRKHEYARLSCVKASQEVLQRFIALRTLNRIACSCRTIDFLALMAAMTLLLAHLDSHGSEDQNFLAHSYHSDRAMIEQVQDNMKEVNRLNSDAMSAQSAELLGRLLAIKPETAGLYPTRRVSVHQATTATDQTDNDEEALVSVHIPYFGIIKIACEDMRRTAANPTATNHPPTQFESVDKPNATGPKSLFPENHMLVGSNGTANIKSVPQVYTDHDRGDSPAMIPDIYAGTQATPRTIPTPVTHYTLQPQDCAEYPELAAGGEDWAFQGVDLAFFDCLMRSTGNEGS